MTVAHETASSVCSSRVLARDVSLIYTSRAYAIRCQCPSVCDGSALGRGHTGNTAAAPAREVEAIIRSPTNMAAADVAAVEGRGHLALC